MLADLIDILNIFKSEYEFAHSNKSTFTKPKAYKRPGKKDDRLSIGRDPIPVSKFNDWYYRKGA